MIIDKWHIKKIKEVAGFNELNINNFKYQEIEYIDIASVREGSIIEKKIMKYDDAPSRAKRILRNNDIIISSVRPNLKHYAYIEEVKENTICSTGFIVITPKKVDPRFLYYYLTQFSFTEFLSQIAEAHTSAYPSFNPDIIENSKILLPGIDEQKNIGKILYSIDKKIETNNNINSILEQISQTIFKHWFIDYEFPNEQGKPYKSSGGEFVDSEFGKIPKGWKVLSIDDITEHSNTGGDAIKKTPMVDYNTGIKCVRVGDLSNQRDIDGWGYSNVNEENFRKYQLKKNDIIITRTATLGLNQIIEEDLKAVYNNGLIRIKLNEKVIPLFFYLTINTIAYKKYISRIESESSTRPNMQINYLLKYRFI